mmetsp:Transcript_77786/g.154545  ORF Transcript_77786/g.154545 Transcript_77786/m.154545 type:complete len:283 (+) Transcript_77786:1924-2772(+)
MRWPLLRGPSRRRRRSRRRSSWSRRRSMMSRPSSKRRSVCSARRARRLSRRWRNCVPKTRCLPCATSKPSQRSMLTWPRRGHTAMPLPSRRRPPPLAPRAPSSSSSAPSRGATVPPPRPPPTCPRSSVALSTRRKQDWLALRRCASPSCGIIRPTPSSSPPSPRSRARRWRPRWRRARRTIARDRLSRASRRRWWRPRRAAAVAVVASATQALCVHGMSVSQAAARLQARTSCSGTRECVVLWHRYKYVNAFCIPHWPIRRRRSADISTRCVVISFFIAVST